MGTSWPADRSRPRRARDPATRTAQQRQKTIRTPHAKKLTSAPASARRRAQDDPDGRPGGAAAGAWSRLQRLKGRYPRGNRPKGDPVGQDGERVYTRAVGASDASLAAVRRNGRGCAPWGGRRAPEPVFRLRARPSSAPTELPAQQWRRRAQPTTRRRQLPTGGSTGSLAEAGGELLRPAPRT